ncbi:solute carrier family 22 member 16 isoform X2 [Candoia aspera]|uniref:solute carrier family 22 member 16 isoform X2 n=1 Tax=Candoia aspera TaxID=51853 RepID=UPI002FD7D1EB
MARNFELLFESLGHFGRYQAVVYFASVFQSISCGIHYLASVFLAVTPKFVCSIAGNVSHVLIYNSSRSKVEDAWSLWTSTQSYILVQLENGDIWELNQCSRSKRENASRFIYEYSGDKTDFLCTDGYIYDRTNWQSTIVTEWDLVCQQEWLAKLTQPTFMLGVLFGAVIFGDLADRLGRRYILWLTSTGQFIFGIAVAFTFNYNSFVIVRFLLAMVSSGYLVVVFVYVTEYTGIKARTWASMHIHAFFAVGIMVVALVGYLARTWCCGTSSLCHCLPRNGQNRAEEHPDPIPHHECSDLWGGDAYTSGFQYSQYISKYGWKVCNRNCIWPYLSVHGRALSNSYTIPCCWKWEHDVPSWECGCTFLCLSVKCLDLLSTVDCWNHGLPEWRVNTVAARNTWKTVDKYVGRSCRAR